MFNRKFRFNSIKTQLGVSFFVLAVITLLLVAFTIFQIGRIVTPASQILNVGQPSQMWMNRLSGQVNLSNEQLLNFLHFQDDALINARKQTWEAEVTEAIESLTNYAEDWTDGAFKFRLEEVLANVENIRVLQDAIEENALAGKYQFQRSSLGLSTGDSIVVSTDLVEALNITEGVNEQEKAEFTRLANLSSEANTELRQLYDDFTNVIRREGDGVLSNVDKFKVIEGIFLVLVFVIAFFLYRFVITNLVDAYKQIEEKAATLSVGNLIEQTSSKIQEFELVNSELNALSDNMANLKSVALAVGKGEFDIDVDVFNNEGDIGESLGNMRASLKNISEEDRQRNWINKGHALFGDIVRQNADNLEKLSAELITEMVKYLDANQGSLFIKDQDRDDPAMELMATYAYDRQKFFSKTISPGQGLIGQCWLEKQSIYMTKVPQEYVAISSGLGGSTPNCILIVPFKINDEVYGVVELASFKEFEDHEREFVENLGESIASSISSVNINQSTKRLLEESQQMGEELQAQEEEMRQNMEELQATQEEMQRGQRELIQKEHNLSAFINSTEDTIFALDKEYKILVVNDTLKSKFQATGIELKIGSYINEVLPGDLWSEWKPKYDKAMNEGSFTEVRDDSGPAGKKFTQTFFTPIRDENGKIIGASVTSRDISDLALREEEARNSQEKLDALINCTEDSIMVISRDLVIEMLNATALKRYEGTTVKVGAKVLTYAEEDQEEIAYWHDIYERAFNGEVQSFVLDNTEFEKKPSFREYFVYPVTNSDGYIDQISISSRDVTEQQVAQGEIKKQEAQLNSLINNTDDSIMAIDRDYKITLINETLQRRFEESQYDLKEGGDSLDGLESHIRKLWEDRYSRGFKGEKQQFVMDSEMEGEEKEFRQFYINPISDDKGQYTHLSITSRDITEAERSRQEIRAKEERLNALINSSEESILTIDRDFNIVIMNKVAQDRYAELGLKEGDSVTKGDSEEEIREWTEKYNRAFDGEALHMELEVAKGVFRKYSVTPVENSDGSIDFVSIVSSDISKRVASGLVAEERAKELDAILNGTDDAISVIDSDFNIVHINKASLARYTNPEQIPKIGEYALKGFDSVEEEWKGYYTRAFNGEKIHFVLENPLGRDQIVYREYFINPIKGQGNEVEYVSIISRDVTDRQLAMNELEELKSGKVKVVPKTSDKDISSKLKANQEKLQKIIKGRNKKK